MAHLEPNNVEVEIIIDDDGNVKTEILRHGEGSNCLHEDDQALMQEFFDEDMVDLEDMGKTDEYYEETKPQSYKVPDGPSPNTTQKKEDDKINLGYGV
jgi:hypothetical protein